MTTAADLIKKVDELSELALKEDGYPYMAGFLRASLTSMLIGYVPKDKWQEAIDEIQESVNYLNEIQKNK